MMESSRGPGFIGTLLALVVLAIFVLFYLFAFDEGMQGGNKNIASVIKEQTADIARLNEEIGLKGRTLSTLPALKEQAKALASANSDIQSLESRITNLEATVESATADIAEKTKEFEIYKDRYRAFVRNKAKGETLDELETTKETFKNVTIREVSAVGMQIRYEGGLKRVPYEELHPEMQDYYQFDSAQKDHALAEEDSVRKQHDAAVGAAEKVAAGESVAQNNNAINEIREKAAQKVRTLEGQIKVLESEISSLRSDLSLAASAAASARAAGRIHRDKTGEITRNINSKQTRIQNIRAEINRMPR